jgi:hypothetical protein
MQICYFVTVVVLDLLFSAGLVVVLRIVEA